ncbi:hypothetical protein Q1695_012632 [Nippostrongylus brasiliensis]|nr:hypothetical protein Q1695_012632 [Nippostrongylus brasiliensis]
MTFSQSVSDVETLPHQKSDDRENSLIARPKEKKISTTFALINLMKGMVGPGCFAVPLAFKQGGLWGAFGVDFLLGIVSTVCMTKLVRCSQLLCEKNKCGPLDYGQMAEEAFASSYQPLHRFKLAAKWIVNTCLIFLQFGICSVFYIFVVDHAKEVVDHVWPHNGLSRNDYFLFALPAFLLLSLVRSIVILSYVCLFGNVLMTVCLGIILTELATAKHIPTSELPAITDMNGIVMAAGSILYALEGQAMVLPLENKMEHPQYMGGLTGVLWTGVPLVTLIYAACGFYGYIAFGNDVQASITLNLSDSPLNFSVKCMLLCVVYSGFLIQQYPLVEILWPLAKQPLRERKIRRAYIIALEYVFRFSIVFVALGISWLIPNLDEIIPLIGVSAGMLLALVWPALLEMVVFLQEWTANFRTAKLLLYVGLDCFYIVLGVFFVVTGLQANIRNLINGETS